VEGALDSDVVEEAVEGALDDVVEEAVEGALDDMVSIVVEAIYKNK